MDPECEKTIEMDLRRLKISSDFQMLLDDGRYLKSNTHTFVPTIGPDSMFACLPVLNL